MLEIVGLFVPCKYTFLQCHIMTICKNVKFRAFPTYAFKAYLLCEISILICCGIWLFLGHEVVQFLVRFPVHGVFERCCVAGYAEGIEQRRFNRAE